MAIAMRGGASRSRKGVPSRNTSAKLNLESLVEYIVIHRGPDPDGRCAPMRQGGIDLNDLRTALELAQARGVSASWKAWHFKGANGRNDDPEIVKDILCARVESFIGVEHREDPSPENRAVALGRLRELLTKDLEKRFKVTVEGRQLEMTFSPILCDHFGSSGYQVVVAYLEAIGFLDEAKAFMPYHMKTLPKGVLHNQETAEKVLGMKVRQLLEDEYDGDPVKLVKGISNSELCRAICDDVAGTPIEIRVDAFVRASAGFVDALQRGFRGVGFAEFAQSLRPYHVPTAPQNTYSRDSEYPRELLVKAFNQLLPRYGGNVVSMLTGFTIEEISEPVRDLIVNPKTNKQELIEVSPLTMIVFYRGDRWTMIQEYLRATGNSRIERDLKPYHLDQGARGYLEKPRVRDAMLKKRMEQLLRGPYKGDLIKFVTSVTYDEVAAPFKCRVAGQEINVSTESLLKRFGYSTFKIVKRYLELVEKELAATFDSEKRRKRTMYSLTEKETGEVNLEKIRSILFFKLDQLRESNPGPLDAFVGSVTEKMLTEPAQVTFGEGKVPVTTLSAYRKWCQNGRDKGTLLEDYRKERENKPELPELPDASSASSNG